MDKSVYRTDAAMEQGYVPNKRLFAYSAAIAGQNMHYAFINGWLFYFCNNILKIKAEYVGYITGISRIWDAVNDPIVGALIDRHIFKKTGEKLRPFLIYLPPFIGILSLLMFMDFGLGSVGAVVLILICYLSWDVIYSMQDVSLWGMLSISSPHSEERARVAQWTAIGVTVGCAIAGTFPVVRDIMVNKIGISDKKSFIIGAALLGLGGQLVSMLAGFMREQVKNEAAPKESFFEAIFVLRHNKTMLLISLARILEYFKLTVPWQYFFESQVFYKVGGMEIGGGTMQFIYGGLTGAPGAFAMLAATKIVEAVGGMKKILIIAQISAVALRIVSFFVGFKSIWRMLIVILLMGLQSIPASMMNIAHRSLMSDSIDYVEYTTGKRTEGITFSMQNFATKIGDAVALLINGQILKYVKYNERIAMTAQNAVFMKWQWPLFILGPAVGAILYLIVIAFVKDDREQQRMIETELKKRRDGIVAAAKTEMEAVD